MSGGVTPLLQYAFMAWCSVKAQGQLYLYLYLHISVHMSSSTDLHYFKFLRYNLEILHRRHVCNC